MWVGRWEDRGLTWTTGPEGDVCESIQTQEGKFRPRGGRAEAWPPVSAHGGSSPCVHLATMSHFVLRQNCVGLGGHAGL